MKLKTLLSAIALLACANANAELLIDDFSTPQGLLAVGGAPGSASNTAFGAGILGGYRDLYLSLVSGTGVATANVAGGTYKYGTSGDDTSGNAKIRWDGDKLGSGASGHLDALDPTGLCDPVCVNLSGNGSAITFSVSAEYDTVLTTTLGNVDVIIYNGAGGTATYSFDIIVTGGPQTFAIDFTDIDWVFGGSFIANGGFTNVGAILVDIDTNSTAIKLDIDLDQVEVVPEPAALALVGVGLLGLGLGGRRRKAK